MNTYTEINTGDIITFGHYTLDNWENCPIEWIVLAKEEAKILLLSRYGLDTQSYNNNQRGIALPPYYNDYTSVTWEICTLRQWLNGIFYDYSFSDDEKKLIWLSKLENPDNPQFGTKGRNPTADRVFLLSLDEAEKYLDSEEKRFCRPTEWAKYSGAFADEYTGASLWWLRSPGYNAEHAAVMPYDPYLSPLLRFSGQYVTEKNIVVRPALWLLNL